MNIDRNRYKTVAEGCTILGISDVTLRKLRKLANSDDIKHGKSVLFDIEAVKDWLANNRLDVSENEVPGRYQMPENPSRAVSEEHQTRNQSEGEVSQSLAALSGAQQQQLISQSEIIQHQKETIELLKEQHDKHIESLEKIQAKTLEAKNRRGAIAIMAALIAISLCFASGVYIVKQNESKSNLESKLKDIENDAQTEKTNSSAKLIEMKEELTKVQTDLQQAKERSDNLAGQYQAKYFEINDKLLQIQKELSQAEMRAKELEAENLILMQQVDPKLPKAEPNQTN